jgi:tripeptide aminopeptidase
VTVSRILAFPGAYRDSLLLLGATRAMLDSDDVSWASAAMATPSVVNDLEGRGFPPDSLAGADANALVLAVEAAEDPAASQALDRGRALLFVEAAPDRDGGAGRAGGQGRAEPDPRTIGEAARLLPEANVAVVSVPGQYAALAAHSALTAGLHVLLQLPQLAAGETALGGDNRSGVACLVTLAATLARGRIPHPPLTLLFTVREESGLHGARELDPADLGGAKMCFNVDGRLASELIVGAVGQENWEATIKGKAAHAGVAPEKGISATLVAALAIAEARKDGWFGKIDKREGNGTSNVGIFGGQKGKAAGDATNVVTDYVYVKGETRSPKAAFATQIALGYKRAFANAKNDVKDSSGATAEVQFDHAAAYPPFNLDKKSTVVGYAGKAVASLGLEPTYVFSNGGLDANWMVRHGIPTVTFGAGQNEAHTVDEWIDLTQFAAACRLAVALATGV